MSELAFNLILLATCLAGPLFLFLLRGRIKVPAGHMLVPGPPSIPIFGNTLQLREQPQKQIRAWAKEYGELFRLNMGRDTWVMLTTPLAVKEILDKQSSVTSGRPEQHVLTQEVSGGHRFVLMSNTPTWRNLRAIVHKVLTPKSSLIFRPSQEFEAKQLIYDILTSNADLKEFYNHVRRYTTSVIMTSTYGRRIPTWDSEEVREVYKVMEEFSTASTPGTFIADALPGLLYLPKWAQWWRKTALAYYERQVSLWTKLWERLQAQMQQNKAPECFLKHFAESDYQGQNVSDLQAAFVAGTMIEAGSETSSSTINSALMYLASNPEQQKLAHDELSAVVGDNRSPTFEDELQLPYIRAIGKETLRLRPVTVFGPPHKATADITYKNYFIPAGTALSIAYYVFHYDEERYEKPFEFRPKRFLNHPEKSGAYIGIGDPYQRDHFSFGAGRRVCPGVHLADNSIYITLAKILWAFEIRPPLGPDGKEELMQVSDDAYEPGGSVTPKQFRVRFQTRNGTIKDTIVREWQEAKEQGYFLGDARVTVDGIVVA